MNNKKKIIDTLRSADKSSVEKLMAEEEKKNEIFAKAQRRANIEQSEYTYSVSGVEKYERRINMTRIISAAASVVLVAGFVGGGAYLMNKGPKHPESETLASVTETVTTTAENTDTATTEQTTNEQNNKFSVTKEELIEKDTNYFGVKYFDKFSADYTIIKNERREYHTEPETLTGKVYIDEVAMTASETEETYVNDALIHKMLCAVKDKKFYQADEAWAETDYVNGGYRSLEAPEKYCYTADSTGDVISVKLLTGRFLAPIFSTPDSFEITGEKTENGRKIISISGIRKDENTYEGVVREYSCIAEIDAETGVTVSFDEFDSEGNNTCSYKLTNYKFNDDAEEFRTASDIISEIENGGYTEKG